MTMQIFQASANVSFISRADGRNGKLYARQKHICWLFSWKLFPCRELIVSQCMPVRTLVKKKSVTDKITITFVGRGIILQFRPCKQSNPFRYEVIPVPLSPPLPLFKHLSLSNGSDESHTPHRDVLWDGTDSLSIFSEAATNSVATATSADAATHLIKPCSGYTRRAIDLVSKGKPCNSWPYTSHNPRWWGGRYLSCQAKSISRGQCTAS